MNSIKIILPDPEHAKKMGWKYQIQWTDDGLPCFYRRSSIATARNDFKRLTDKGLSPIAVDIFSGEPIRILP